MVTTGLRVSEALGLTWDGVDLDRRVVRVTKTKVNIDDELWVDMPPKSAAGNRVVALSQRALEALDKLPRDREHAFRDGSIAMRRNLYRDLWQFCQLAGVPRISVHGLRLVAATTAVKATHDPRAISMRLGHGNVSTT